MAKEKENKENADRRKIKVNINSGRVGKRIISVKIKDGEEISEVNK